MKKLPVKKSRAKQWFSVIAPKCFGEMEIGKTIASESHVLMGRRIETSAMDLTGNLEKYYFKFIFKVNRTEGDKVFTEFDGSECLRDYISRMVVRRVRRIDVIQDLIMRDGKKIRVKGIAILRGRVKSTIQKTVRSRIKKLLKTEIENMTLEEFVKKLLSDEIKNKVLKEARKVYPIRHFEIRKTEAI